MAASAAMRAASVSGSGGDLEGGYNDGFEGGKVGGGVEGGYMTTVIAVSLAPIDWGAAHRSSVQGAGDVGAQCTRSADVLQASSVFSSTAQTRVK